MFLAYSNNQLTLVIRVGRGFPRIEDSHPCPSHGDVLAVSSTVTACCPESSGFDSNVEVKLLVGQEPDAKQNFCLGKFRRTAYKHCRGFTPTSWAYASLMGLGLKRG